VRETSGAALLPPPPPPLLAEAGLAADEVFAAALAGSA